MLVRGYKPSAIRWISSADVLDITVTIMYLKFALKNQSLIVLTTHTIIILYTLNIYSFIFQLYISKADNKKRSSDKFFLFFLIWECFHILFITKHGRQFFSFSTWNSSFFLVHTVSNEKCAVFWIGDF